ncbi:MAG: hypothetical protein HY432_03635 [Candidatus Liptonbacteria bacterium]|nr:hypothetical protein [Candidatus Liptonbacteria bacterium]
MESAKKLLLSLLVIALLGIGAFYFIKLNPQMAGEAKAGLLAHGTITAIDAANRELTASIASNGELFGTRKFGIGEKRIAISQKTRINKFFYSENAKGEIEKSLTQEVNIGDLHGGDPVSIIYGEEKNSILQNVESVTVKVELNNFEENIAAEIEKMQNNFYVKGQVVTISAADFSLEYYPYIFGQRVEEKAKTALSSDVKFYAVDDENRIGIEHARKEISIRDIRAGDIIVLTAPSSSDFSRGTVTATVVTLVKDER